MTMLKLNDTNQIVKVEVEPRTHAEGFFIRIEMSDTGSYTHAVNDGFKLDSFLQSIGCK